MTADRLAAFLKINTVLMREQIQQAEIEGYICVDESHEGLRYYQNLFKTWNGN
jgi:hypothetical protein